MPLSPAEHPVNVAGAVKVNVQDAVRAAIISGELQPRTRVTEQSLADRYGVSRIPVREALKGLESEGFVESQPNVGVRVADIPVDEADDLFAVRETLEIATARRAAARAAQLFSTDLPSGPWLTVRRELSSVLAAGDAAVAIDDLDQLPALNTRFHLGVADLSGSGSLGGLLLQLTRKIEWLYASDEHSRGQRLWPEHRIILAAIDSGDADHSADLMARHVRQSRIGYLRRFAPDVPTTDPEVAAAVSA